MIKLGIQTYNCDDVSSIKNDLEKGPHEWCTKKFKKKNFKSIFISNKNFLFLKAAQICVTFINF